MRDCQEVGCELVKALAAGLLGVGPERLVRGDGQKDPHLDARDGRLNGLHDQMGDDLVERVVITTGPRAYRRPDGVAVVPLALLGP